MSKKDKIKFINQVNDRFINAHNHGNNGNNWWYPKQDRIAYNVKLRGRSMSIEDIREAMTTRQNDYYSDDMLYEITQQELSDAATMFSDDLDNEYGVKSGYAGRSGGWLEVDYNNPLTEVDEETSTDDINYYYAEAGKLEKLEATIAEHISTSLAVRIKYQNSKEYCLDIVNYFILSDEDIAETYKGRIKNLTDKLK